MNIAKKMIQWQLDKKGLILSEILTFNKISQAIKEVS
jgi:hypothetical protein